MGRRKPARCFLGSDDEGDFVDHAPAPVLARLGRAEDGMVGGVRVLGRMLVRRRNVAYFNDPKYNSAMRAASLLSGNSRYTAYGNLDVSMTKNNPPWAARSNFNGRILVSKRVGCFTFNSIYSVDLAAVCVK